VATNGTDHSRLLIAYVVLGGSIVSIGVAAGLAIGFASDASRPEMTRLVFTSVLPLFGTWVGTVLAFYFARENLEAAARSTKELLSTTTGPSSVEDVMIPRAQILAFEIAPGTDVDTVSLADLWARLDSTKWERLPIFEVDPANQASVAKAVVHKRVLTAFAALDATKAVPDVFQDQTIANLGADLRPQLDQWDAIGPKATVDEARTKLSGPPAVADIFVTDNGQKTGQVVGWLTNTLLAGVGSRP
jgi:hypothetical protein